ncbi:type II toxin-antitoxin system death-on-curing family toxin [Mycobacteroides abscessus]|uniref:type II toxin-antitoxin system death-on-curing family toxin n=1 Tax=Mycobacteroides abscessus TaxID=36809 RepID=UPI0005E4C37C|nr:type II toxin-antitoxin system death-on-curing family toxin [Mycobacteroides abscessus]CPW87944.1 death-on-curing family protein [Mycobacteroides abscessus]
MIKRLSVASIIGINESLMGWNHAVTDLAGLESAANQPFVTWDGEDLDQTLVEKAAVLLRGIAANHPFHEGNKRTAWIACTTFLSLNGSPLESPRADPIEAGRMVESLVKHEITIEHVILWLVERLA